MPWLLHWVSSLTTEALGGAQRKTRKHLPPGRAKFDRIVGFKYDTANTQPDRTEFDPVPVAPSIHELGATSRDLAVRLYLNGFPLCAAERLCG
jgi:hypothetical protein